MKRIYTMDGDPAMRHLTGADRVALKGQRKLAQATAPRSEKARAAIKAGLDMQRVTAGDDLRRLRAAAPDMFLNAALPRTRFARREDVLRSAIERGWQ